MHAKEGDEYVALHQEFLCAGAVENWLTRLVQRMRDTLKEILARAKASADHWEQETPRERWLFDYPAQIALTASQIIWTEEVVCQFEAFQDGYVSSGVPSQCAAPAHCVLSFSLCDWIVGACLSVHCLFLRFRFRFLAQQ